MRRIASSCSFFLLLALATAGCGSPSNTDDAGMGGVDTGSGTDDAGQDAATVMRDVGVDAGQPPLCTGTGCELVGIELMAATSCVIRANGQVDCWGRGQDGELGDGLHGHGANCRLTAGEAAVDCSPTATTVALPSVPSSIVSRGSIQACAILGTAHEVWCWGGQFYKLGSNSEHSRFEPEHVLIDTTAIADGATDLGTSFGNLCWVAADTTVHCIGSGRSGVLGNGAFDDEAMPVTVLSPDGTGMLTGVLEVETASGHTCARTASTLYCWGNNHYGQIGAPPPHQTCIAAPTMYDCAYQPVEVTGVDATHVVDIQLGDSFSCVLLDTGHVQCWGGGQSGGLGTGDINATPDPVEPMGLDSVDELRVVEGGACALRHDGTVWCWGPANLGQVGDGSMVHASTPCIDGSGAPYDCQLTPVQVMGVTGATHIGMGEAHACAIIGTNEVRCWGQSLRYQLGDEMRPDPQFSPVVVTALGL